ncbi:metallophosphoesterase, partial [Klebsiella pneumoniae]|uniref:metallophosphoesterase n=1 Tax=Klebsiella pneumoniae TaxID=573 RepID=UPI00385433FE
AEGLRTARDNHCDLFIHLGDVFHRIEVSAECRNLVIATLAADENGDPWPFEKYTIVGNHDIDHNIQNLKRSSLASLIKSGLLRCVDDIPEYRIGFGHFRESLEQEMKDGYCAEGNNLIWAVHANVTVDDFFESANYIKFSDTPLNDECKLLVAGHIHFPLSQKREDGKQFINPGSVSRREAISE